MAIGDLPPQEKIAGRVDPEHHLPETVPGGGLMLEAIHTGESMGGRERFPVPILVNFLGGTWVGVPEANQIALAIEIGGDEES